MPALIQHLRHTRTALAVRIGHCRRASPAPVDVGHIHNRRRSRIDRTGRHQHPPPLILLPIQGKDEVRFREALRRKQSDAPEALEAVEQAEARELKLPDAMKPLWKKPRLVEGSTASSDSDPDFEMNADVELEEMETEKRPLKMQLNVSFATSGFIWHVSVASYLKGNKVLLFPLQALVYKNLPTSISKRRSQQTIGDWKSGPWSCIQVLESVFPFYEASKCTLHTVISSIQCCESMLQLHAPWKVYSWVEELL
ncbi:hypothetical protein C8J56DRAFT_896534 [Mycena floridula]|nr:hypothetical protein C8J56DRAFT_896534 [Mycena floridula]